MDKSEYWQPEIETMPREQLEKLQLERLKNAVKQASKSEFYKRTFAEKGLSADTIQTLDDLKKFPYTTKQDLRDNYPLGLLAVPMTEVVRLHSSSGTTGNPTVIAHTATDIDQWANQLARCLYMVGLRNTDVIQNTSGYGMFTGGFGYEFAIEKLGATSVPAGSGNSRRQVKFMTDFGTTAFHAIPSYATRLAEVFAQMGVDPRTQTKLTTMLIGAEPHSEEQRRRIEQLFGVKAYNCFGMSEMNGPGVAFECKCQNGLHIWEDYVIPEIIDPETLEPVPDGTVGELVLTTLNREAMPLIRYRTRDLTSIVSEPCPCGRTHRRITRLQGRSDDMIILKGVNIFPIQIERVLVSFPQLSSNYLITLETQGNNDEMLIQCELSDTSLTIAEISALTKEVVRLLKDEILCTPRVQIVPPKTLPESEGKAVRVKDLRKKF